MLGELAPAIARDFGAHGSLLYTVLRPGAVNQDLLSATDNFDDVAHVTYTNYFQPKDEVSRRAMRKSPALVSSMHELIDEADLLRTEIYNDYFRGLGMFRMLAGVFPVHGDLLGVINLHRSQGESDFTAADRRRLEALVPHLARAVQLRRRLGVGEQDRALTVEVLDRLALGAIIVDADSRLVFANPLAMRVLTLGQGLTLAHGRLRALQHDPAEALAKAVRVAAATVAGIGAAPGAGTGGLVVVPRAEHASLSLLISPFRSTEQGAGAGKPMALVMFSDTSVQAHIPAHILARAMGLAKAEARLLAALIAGQTMADYTVSAGVTMNTAKTQLRQIFLKTGHNRQADLIRSVLGDPLMKLAAQDQARLH